MKYKIKEIFFTQQGEGKNTGMNSVFIRFTGCNLWSGKEKNRGNAICNFCDTNFYGTDGVNGGSYTKEELLEKVRSIWMGEGERINVVLTGGEPLLQANQQLIDHLKENNFYIAIETNGTIVPPNGIDWICVSPKPNTKIKITEGDELKFIYPQPNFNPKLFEKFNFKHFYIQPMDSNKLDSNINQSIKYCMKNANWKISLQSHKILGIQ
tara:strand:- start:1292 stop:1921 length:630 start_codon:yes stop_codon:yes gene_type:complete